MKIYSLSVLFLVSVFLFGCTGSSNTQNNSGDSGKKAALDVTAPAAVKDIEVAQLKEMIASPDAPILIDVRTPDEWNSGTIAGANKINFQNSTFRDEISKLDRTKNYVVYCAAGGRSSKASGMMNGLGFANVSNLLGGINSWKESGGAVVNQ